MIVRIWHIGKVASLRDAREMLIFSHRTALRLYGVIKIKPLRGFFMANADIQNIFYDYPHLAHRQGRVSPRRT